MQIERREAPKFSMGTVKQVAEAVGAAVAETQDTIGMYDENITSVEVFWILARGTFGSLIGQFSNISLRRYSLYQQSTIHALTHSTKSLCTQYDINYTNSNGKQNFDNDRRSSILILLQLFSSF